MRAGCTVWPRDVFQAPQSSRASIDARRFRIDLSDLQDLPHDAGQVHPVVGGVHRHRDGDLLRLAPRGGVHADEGGDHRRVQPGRHRRQLWRRLVRHPHQHLRQFAGRVRQPGRQALSDLRNTAAGRHQHRYAADLRRAGDHALDSAVRAGPVRRALLHRLRHRRVARGGSPPHCGRYFHEDRRHRCRLDEDRLQDRRG